MQCSLAKDLVVVRIHPLQHKKLNMKKRKLWSYGCSYSHQWGHLKGWPRFVAEELDLELNDDNIEIPNQQVTWVHMAGKGFSKHREFIIKDFPKWGPDDIVIIEESVRLRSYSPYFKKDEYDELLGIDLAPYLENRPNLVQTDYIFPEEENDDYTKVRRYIGWHMFHDFVKMLLTVRRNNTFIWQYEGEHINWCYNDPEPNNPNFKVYNPQGAAIKNWNEWNQFVGDNKLLFPHNKESYVEWMGNDTNVWFNYLTLDDHQSQYGHEQMANSFIEQIKARMV